MDEFIAGKGVREHTDLTGVYRLTRLVSKLEEERGCGERRFE